MSDSTDFGKSLVALVAGVLPEDEPFDWDPSALADWPNIDPFSAPAAQPPARSWAAEFDRAP